MLDALSDVQQSLERVASSGKVGPAFRLLGRLQGFIDRGVASQQETFARVRDYTDEVHQVMDLMRADDGLPLAEREPLFTAKIDEFRSSSDDKIYIRMANVMTSFQRSLFAGADLACYPRDNLDLERWFRLPKSHERRIHGHHHAGICVVREGSTLIPTLDAHVAHPDVFSHKDLSPFETAAAPPSQLASQQRRVPSCGKDVPQKRPTC